MLEEEEAEVPVPVSNETSKMESDMSQNNPIAADIDVKMQDSINSTVENGSADANEKPDEKAAQVGMDTKVKLGSFTVVVLFVFCLFFLLKNEFLLNE